ncbi:efflux RND transporter periplasmic adaptor subunit [Luteibacter sp. Lutesp34]|uniref:efflux RND transporter periplasmic adaptor subunit n=1 Tax=Luteibacter sp. Lutesp34 TaxID=3243030 RepID=UPI0039B4013A
MRNLWRPTLTSLALLVLAGCQDTTGEQEAHTVASAAVGIAPAHQGTMPRTVVAWGEVSAGPAYQQAVAMPAEGALASLAVGPGERVRAGQEIGVFALSASAKAAWKQAETTLATATQALARVRRLRKDNLATNEQVGLAEKAVADARAGLTVFPSLSLEGERAAVRAPVDGTIVAVSATLGQTVPANTPLLTVTPASKLTLASSVEPRQATLVKAGMAVALAPVGGGDGLTGHVIGVGDAVDAQTRLVPVRIQMDRMPMAGSAWRAEIAVGEVRGWIVPSDAVIDDGDSRSIYQVHNGKAHRVVIKVLYEHDGQAVVEAAMDPTAPMVVVGAPQLSEGMAVVTGTGAQ